MCKDMDLVFSTGQKIFILNFKKDTALERFAVCHPCPAFSPTQRRQCCPILQVKSLSLVRMRPACCAGTGNSEPELTPRARPFPHLRELGASSLSAGKLNTQGGSNSLIHPQQVTATALNTSSSHPGLPGAPLLLSSAAHYLPSILPVPLSSTAPRIAFQERAAT